LEETESFLINFFDVLLSFGDLNERSTTVNETLKEVHALVDSFESEVVLLTVSLVEGLGLISLTGSHVHLLLGGGDELLVSKDEGFESLSLWVEGVLEMSGGNTESDLGVSESLVDFLVEFVMLSSHPSVFFLLGTEFEVEISDEVLEGGDQFVHWAISFDL
jgi:hypothetical protein